MAINKSGTKEKEVLCHNSIAMRAATQFQVMNAKANLGPMLCETIDKEIKSKEKEEIKAQMAYMMARCWWMFNEGRQDDLFEEIDSLGDILGLSESKNMCFLCYTAIMPKEIEDGGIEAKEMMKYILKTEHPKIPNLPYIDYFQEYGGSGTVAVMNDIVPNRLYGVLYLSKSSESDSTLRNIFGGILLGVVGISCVISFGITCGVGIAATAAYWTGNLAKALEGKKLFYGKPRSISMVVLDDLKGIERSGCKITSDSVEGGD
jgi:hypothetical protein